jgi:hypothetical protein
MEITSPSSQPLFDCGHLIMSPLVGELVEANELDIQDYLARHARGDWGDIDTDLCQANRDAVRKQAYVISIFPVTETLNLVLCTELDRGETTAMLIAPQDPRLSGRCDLI